jgi:hypothetical protein
MEENEEIKDAILVSNIDELLTDVSFVNYQCPYCGKIHSLEPDAGIIKCKCGRMINCNLISLL